MGYHLQAKQKARTNDRRILRGSLARALMALALVDIHDGFFPAPLAVDLDLLPGCLRVDPQDFGSAAHRAQKPAVFHCQYLTMFLASMQYGFLPFYTVVKSSTYISSI